MRDTGRQTRRREFRASETWQSQGQACTLKELGDPGSTGRIYFFRWLPDKTTGHPTASDLGDLEIFFDMDLANI